MVKVDIKTLDSTTANDVTATKTINDNFEALQNAIEDTISRSGKVPNYMQTDLDLNHNKLINLADPKEDRDAVTLKYVKDTVGDAKHYADKAEAEAIKANKTVEAAKTYLQISVDEARIWANGDDDEVDTVAPGQNEHSSRGYADLSMAIANTPEDTPIDMSSLLAVDVIRGPKGDKGDRGEQGPKGDKGDPGEALSGDVEYEGTLNVISDHNHPIKVTGMAGTSASGFQIEDSLGAGETDLEHFATGDRYGSRITNRSTATGKEVHIDLYQTNAGKSVMDFTDVDSVIVPTVDSTDDSERVVNSTWVNSAIETRTLKTAQITNCITEIPQNIKLEYSGNTVTLKAGSKITVPRGSGVFEEIIIDTDKSTTFSSNTGADAFLIYSTNSSTLTSAVVDSAVSGTDTSSASGLWYNTNKNQVGYGSYTSYYSFPLAIVSKDTDGTITSIKQVFNSMGYIGSTIFYLKGFKGLAPNDRNADGSLKNVEYTQNKVTTYTFSSTDTTTRGTCGIRHDTGNFTWYTSWYYDEAENYNKVSSGVWKSLPLAEFTVSSGKITSFSPKSSFRALDANENISYVVKSYSNGTDWYRVYSDGWCEQGGWTVTGESVYGVTVTLLKPFKDTNYSVFTTGRYTNSSDKGWNYAHTLTTTNFKAVQTSSGVYWEAKGYIR